MVVKASGVMRETRTDREARLALALRENLRRRKAQARELGEPATDAGIAAVPDCRPDADPDLPHPADRPGMPPRSRL